jgi:hypothetical protein
MHVRRKRKHRGFGVVPDKEDGSLECMGIFGDYIDECNAPDHFDAGGPPPNLQVPANQVTEATCP